jgi:hypothetical protein
MATATEVMRFFSAACRAGEPADCVTAGDADHRCVCEGVGVRCLRGVHDGSASDGSGAVTALLPGHRSCVQQ